MARDLYEGGVVVVVVGVVVGVVRAKRERGWGRTRSRVFPTNHEKTATVYDCYKSRGSRRPVARPFARPARYSRIHTTGECGPQAQRGGHQGTLARPNSELEHCRNFKSQSSIRVLEISTMYTCDSYTVRSVYRERRVFSNILFHKLTLYRVSVLRTISYAYFKVRLDVNAGKRERGEQWSKCELILSGKHRKEKTRSLCLARICTINL